MLLHAHRLSQRGTTSSPPGGWPAPAANRAICRRVSTYRHICGVLETLDSEVGGPVCCFLKSVGLVSDLTKVVPTGGGGKSLWILGVSSLVFVNYGAELTSE